MMVYFLPALLAEQTSKPLLKATLFSPKTIITAELTRMGIIASTSRKTENSETSGCSSWESVEPEYIGILAYPKPR